VIDVDHNRRSASSFGCIRFRIGNALYAESVAQNGYAATLFAGMRSRFVAAQQLIWQRRGSRSVKKEEALCILVASVLTTLNPIVKSATV